MINLGQMVKVVVWAWVLLFGVACNGSDIAQTEPDQITVQLSWFHSVEFAGFYVAEQQGFYADENLAVNLVPGSAEVVPLAEVKENRANFGVTGGDTLMIARAEGTEVKAIATIFRQNPIVLMALEQSGIKKPQDLAGKRVGIFSPEFDNANDIQLAALLHQMEVDESEVEFVLIEDYSLGSLTSGAMDVYNGFATEEPSRIDLEGVDLNLIYPQDYGILMYANVIFTRQELIDDRPDLVERFTRATLKGYLYAVENPEEMVDLALQYNESLNPDFQRRSMVAEIPLVDSGDAPIGTMDEIVWQKTQEILLEQNLITASIDLDQVYTNQFITEPNTP